MITQQQLRANCLLVAQIFLVLKVREHGSNKGEVVETFLRKQGGSPGQPWCVAFVAWIYETICMLFGVKPLINANLSCSDIHHKAEHLGLLIPPEAAQTGDWFLVRGGDTGWRHVAFIRAPMDDSGMFATIEGNTNSHGSAEGDGVYKGERHFSTGVVVRTFQ